MPYIIIVSSLVFTFLLIRATLLNDPNRFTFKLIACGHFLLLGMSAMLFATVSKGETGILYGLLFSFCGDIFLGLRSKGKLYFKLGFSFFILAQCAYLSIYAFSSFNILIFVVMVFIQIIGVTGLLSKTGLDLPVNTVPFILLYDLVLVGVVTLAFGNYVQDHSWIHLLRLAGALFFLLSDTILFTVYFIRPKRKVQIILYLSLYHCAQLLYAFTLWL
jgi:uncharacterized membrane protein YhhN